MREIANHKADREELNQLIKEYEETMEEIRNEVSDISTSQSELQRSTSQPMTLSEAEIIETNLISADIAAIKTFWNGMVDADSTAKTEYSDAQTETKELEKKLSTFLEAIGKNGGKVGSLDIDKLRSDIFQDKGMLETLEKKLTEGKSLTGAERELLYNYLQNEFFSKDDHKKMKDISDMMEKDEEKFKDYINDNVLSTEAHLEAEIMYIELYLFAGNEDSENLPGSDNDRIKWANYLQVLKNAHMDVQEASRIHNWDRDRDDPLHAHVEFIETEILDSPRSIRTKSNITIKADPEIWDGVDDDVIFNSEDPGPTHVMDMNSNTNAEYFFGRDGIIDYSTRKQMNMQDEMNTYTGDFISGEVFSRALGLLPGEQVMSLLLTYGSYSQGKRENERKMTVEEIEQTATQFHLELHVNEHRGGSVQDIELTPSSKTHAILERWEAAHQVDSSIPYPEEEIKNQDWDALTTLMVGEPDDEDGGIRSEMTHYDEDGNRDTELYDYIMDGDDSDNETVQNAKKILDQ